MTSRNAYVLEVSLNMLYAFVLHLSLYQMSFEWSYYKILQIERTVGLRLISYTVSIIALFWFLQIIAELNQFTEGHNCGIDPSSACLRYLIITSEP